MNKILWIWKIFDPKVSCELYCETTYIVGNQLNVTRSIHTRKFRIQNFKSEPNNEVQWSDEVNSILKCRMFFDGWFDVPFISDWFESLEVWSFPFKVFLTFYLFDVWNKRVSTSIDYKTIFKVLKVSNVFQRFKHTR